MTNDYTHPQVLKVRLQTQDSHGTSSSSSSTQHSSTSTTTQAAPKAPATSHASPRVGKSSFSPLPSPAFPFPPPPAPAPKPARTADGTGRLVGPTGSHPPAPSKPGILSLYRSEGIRFFFAGTAGPILGLAFIDSAFFGLYGRMMWVPLIGPVLFVCVTELAGTPLPQASVWPGSTGPEFPLEGRAFRSSRRSHVRHARNPGACPQRFSALGKNP